MFAPSNAFHGCFGHRRFSVGKFAGEASEFIDDSEWKQVRNKKGVRHFPCDHISKFSKGWKVIPNSHHLINLAVAPKANDQRGHVSLVHQKSNMTKRGKSVRTETKNDQEESMEKFQKMLIEIKNVEQELTKESQNLDKNLKLLTDSTKKSANLLLVKKCLYRLLMELQLQRLPKFNENNMLPRDNERKYKKTSAAKHIDRILQNIDGIRKCVGDFDIKIFTCK
jgi:hypothetical protein